jgi:hypothetical protein
MPDRQPRDGEGEDVGFHKGGCDEGPGVDERHRWDEGEVWDHQAADRALEVNGG